MLDLLILWGGDNVRAETIRFPLFLIINSPTISLYPYDYDAGI
jgi:hypothetical protein